MNRINKMTLPENISLERVASLSNRIRVQENESLEVDLSETTNIHISFIGYLLHLKNKIEEKGGKLILKLSAEIKKIFFKLGIYDFFVA